MTALTKQIGGQHYKDMAIQPMEYSMQNGLDACQHTIIKYVTRFREKGGIEDLEKAKHCIDLLIHFEQEKPSSESSGFDEGRMDAIGRNGNDGEHYGSFYTHWNGGEQPVPHDAVVELLFRDGEESAPVAAKHLRWEHEGTEWDVIGYRVLPDSK